MNPVTPINPVNPVNPTIPTSRVAPVVPGERDDPRANGLFSAAQARTQSLEASPHAGPDSAELLRQVHTDQAHFRQVAEQISALPEPADLTPHDPLPASLQADNPLVSREPLSTTPRATQAELNLALPADTLDG
ncbi:hypothetical protein, partial [Pseudomonas brassicae]|uniref:hypothetical protein n=1 Tax=Pseudomonas brassicae TaxID=2708063 RepID=UPI001FB395DD